MLTCARCHVRPCRCRPVRHLDPDEELEGLFAIRAKVGAVSLEYLLWLDGNGRDPEPALPLTEHEQVRLLVSQVEAMLGT